MGGGSRGAEGQGGYTGSVGSVGAWGTQGTRDAWNALGTWNTRSSWGARGSGMPWGRGVAGGACSAGGTWAPWGAWGSGVQGVLGELGLAPPRLLLLTCPKTRPGGGEGPAGPAAAAAGLTKPQPEGRDRVRAAVPDGGPRLSPPPVPQQPRAGGHGSFPCLGGCGAAGAASRGSPAWGGDVPSLAPEVFGRLSFPVLVRGGRAGGAASTLRQAQVLS